jgi:hypothetical protein
MKIAAVSLLATISSASAFAPNQQQTTSTTTLSASRREVMDTAAVAFSMAILPQVAAAEPRPIHLTKPTDEFRANEAKAMLEFKQGQLMLKKEFLALMVKFPSEPNDEDALVKDIHDFQMLVKKTQELPVGLKKEELFKAIRSKKAKGYWPTSMEIA